MQRSIVSPFLYFSCSCNSAILLHLFTYSDIMITILCAIYLVDSLFILCPGLGVRNSQQNTKQTHRTLLQFFLLFKLHVNIYHRQRHVLIIHKVGLARWVFQAGCLSRCTSDSFFPFAKKDNKNDKFRFARILVFTLKRIRSLFWHVSIISINQISTRLRKKFNFPYSIYLNLHHLSAI